MFYFICLCGVPPLEGQFENLDLPGKKSVLPLYGFGEYTEEQYLKKFDEACFGKWIGNIRDIVER